MEQHLLVVYISCKCKWNCKLVSVNHLYAFSISKFYFCPNIFKSLKGIFHLLKEIACWIMPITCMISLTLLHEV